MTIPVYVNYKCPFCKNRIDAFKQECASCGLDVSLFSDLYLLPYALINQGLESLESGDKWGALTKFCAALEFDKKNEYCQSLLSELAVDLGLGELSQIYRTKQIPEEPSSSNKNIDLTN